MRRLTCGGALAALALATAAAPAAAAPARIAPAPAPADQPGRGVTLSVGAGQLVRLVRPISDVFVADDKIADVQVKGQSQLYVFGKAPGETNVYATDARGAVVWSATVRVGANLGSVGAMLRVTMPEAQITATPMTGMVVLTGSVARPADIEEAQRLVEAYVGKDTTVVNRLKTATPMQVNLQVKIAEVNRDFFKQVGVDLLAGDNTSGFQFGIAQGEGIEIGTGNVVRPPLGAALAFRGNLLGLGLIAALNLAENDGFVTMLAEPNLTALSGETASFLAGGEIPIPISQGFGAVSIEYKQYGVSLAFTPVVLSDGRISMRVRPEVSQLSDAGSVELANYSIPALTTRRAETTVELGSGQAFMIGGLLNNGTNNTVRKTPFLGDLPVLGTLFRSNNFRRQQSELVIIVTPYLVKPTDPSRLRLPTDGYRAPTDAQRVIGGQSFSGETGAKRPQPQEGPAK